MCEKFNIKATTTPSYSLWGNGLCEKHNQFLTKMLDKVLDDTKCDYDTALAWAVNAQNAATHCNEFRPAQLVFGWNSNLTYTINDLLPALEIPVQFVDVA